MKASVYQQYGAPSVLSIKDIEMPTPNDTELLVKVHATTVNRSDCAMLRAKPFIMRFMTGLFKPKKSILGTDFAGEIVDVGKNISGFKVGDKIFGFHDLGLCSHAEFLTISEDKAFISMPKNCNFKQAAASAEGAHYAYNAINKVTLKPNQKVLVNGASGAIGSASVQLLKHFGADVSAVVNTDNLQRIKDLGANRVIDYLTEDFTQERKQYDLILDAVGKSSFSKCKPQLSPKGIYISSEPGWMAQNIFLALITPLLGRKKVIFPIPVNTRRSLCLIKKLIEKEAFDAVIDREYSLNQIADAFRYVETGGKTGNVIININSN